MRTAPWFLFALFALCTTCTPLAAQDTLAELQATFKAEARRLAESSPSREQRQELLTSQAKALQKFVAEVAKGDDRWNGRLMLADLRLALDDRDGAIAALRGIQVAAAPPLVLVSAAAMAQHLNQRPLRDEWVAAALAKDAPLEERLAMARMLMTVLHEVEQGEAIFQKALAAATDDEQRALVRWHRADGLRDREDLGDDTGFEELEKLANDLPATYWGGVAKDRLRATRLKPGDEAIPFTAKDRTGAPVSLTALRGKAVVLVFWSAGDRDLPNLLNLLGPLRQELGDRLAVLGINLDRDPRAIDAAIRTLRLDFPVVGDGQGIATDAALRWFVEGPVVHVLDQAGRIQALGLHAGTQDGRDELTGAIRDAAK